MDPNLLIVIKLAMLPTSFALIGLAARRGEPLRAMCWAVVFAITLSSLTRVLV